MGNGAATYDATMHRYFIDLFVTANYDADALAHSNRWKKAFEAASKILFDATNGKMQFGRISYLNNGGIVGSDDVRLKSTGTKSSTNQGLLPFQGNSSYVPHVMNEPMVILHECGHYVFLLFDEYVFSGILLRKCQGNSATHECIMEFGKGDGLRLDDMGNEALVQPLHRVSQYCFTNHQPQTGNQQEHMNHQSCWHTIQRRYSQLAFPGGMATTNTLQPIQWEVRSAVSKLAICIPSSAAYSDPNVLRALKSAVKHIARQAVYSGDQLAIAIGPRDLLRPMSRVNLADLGSLYHRIDQVELARPGDARQLIHNASQAFNDQPGAYQTMLLLAPAQVLSEFVDDVAYEVSRRRVILKAKTLGRDSQLQKIDEVDLASPWFEHQNLSVATAELSNFAFALQNELVESLYSQTPGLDIVDKCLGRLPKAETLAFDGMSIREINLEQRDQGFDFPVWIEPGATAFEFVLSEPLAGSISFTLISPQGQEIRQDNPSGATANNITSYYLTDQPPGRWILRLKRRSGNGAELPFFLLAASRNRHISIETQVLNLPSHRVRFRGQISYEYPLDGIHATVDIYRLLSDAQAPGEVVGSAVLHRQKVADDCQVTELSNGWRETECDLPEGDYVALFRWHNVGTAMYISNPSGICQGEVMDYPFHTIPAFTRVQSRRFRVP